MKTEINRFGVSCLPQEIQGKFFSRRNDYTLEQECNADSLLDKYGLRANQDQEDVDLNLGEIGDFDGGVMGFIDRITNKYKPARNRLVTFGKNVSFKAPPTMAQPLIKGGWVRYPMDGSEPQSVPFPIEDTLVIDCETFVKKEGFPLMAAAASDMAYYFWLHPALAGETEYKSIRIPVGQNKLIINFVVKFDSARFAETYSLAKPSNWLFDLKSAHIAVCGASNKQTGMLTRHRLHGDVGYHPWLQKTSPNDLVSCWELHCGGDRSYNDVGKSTRDIFVKSSKLEDIREKLDLLMKYTIQDVEITCQLSSALIPKYLVANPSLAALGGHLESNNSFIPVHSGYKEWARKTNAAHVAAGKRLKAEVREIANRVLAEWEAGTLDMEDPFWSQLDWTKAKGKPKWYNSSLSLLCKATPLLLRISFNGKPLYHDKKHKWMHEATKGTEGAIEIGGKFYVRLPHAKGDQNCGNPLGKDYLGYIDNGMMTAGEDKAKELMELARSMTYWTSVNKRVVGYIPESYRDAIGHMIEPQTEVHGTATRREKERLWLTLSEAKEGRLGSELKSLVRPPKGYKLVGADFDSQESRLFAMFADAQQGLQHGSTPVSVINVIGNKKDRTDSHTLLADHVGVDRNTAKPMNFLLQYLGGKALLASVVKAKRLDLPMKDCTEMATKAISLKKGASIYQQNPGDGSRSRRFDGGTDSAGYNFVLNLTEDTLPYHLAHLSNGRGVRSPLLGSAISEAIAYTNCINGEFMTSRANWAIQTTGSDIRLLFIVLLNHFIEEWGIDGRYCLSIHDEIWTVTREGHEKLMAKAFFVCHALVWSALAYRLGFDTLPSNYLFFSAVNVDSCLRKEVDYQTVTPTWDENVPPGYSLTWADVNQI